MDDATQFWDAISCRIKLLHMEPRYIALLHCCSLLLGWVQKRQSRDFASSFLTGRKFEETFENTSWKKVKRNATNVTLLFHSQAIWGVIWKHTVKKNANDVIADALISHWSTELIVEKIRQFKQCFLTSLQFEETFDDTFDNAQWRKETQPMSLCILTGRQIEGPIWKHTVEKSQWNATNMT